MSYYVPAQSGHSPGDLRDAFTAALKNHTLPAPDSRVLIGDYEILLLELCGLMWHCTEHLPGHACDELDLPRGSTYARAARMLKRGWFLGPH